MRREHVIGPAGLEGLLEVQLSSSIRRRILSIARNAEWPSFIWNTVGCSFSFFSARKPPIPSTISCRIRV